jgi:hypothetical protein
VFVLPSTLSPIDRVPSYCYPYPTDCAKSNNFIIAGEFLPGASNTIAIAHPKGQIDFAFNVMANELEHGLEYHNNANEYYNHAQPGHVHPLWADCRTEASAETNALGCGTGG